MKRFDVAIVGGGPAGSTLGLLLARSGCSVAVLERTDHSDFRIGESLPPAVEPRLRRLALWERVVATHPQPVAGVLSAWGSDELHSSSFITSPQLQGWHIDRSRFDAALSAAAEQAGARVSRRCAVQALRRIQSGSWLLDLASGPERSQLEAQFVVDASGRTAEIARKTGAHRVQIDNLVGISSVFTKSESMHLPSLVEARPDGWWYTAQLPDDRVVAIFFTDADVCAREGLTDPEVYRCLWQQTEHTRARLNDAMPSGSLRVFPAATHRLYSASGDGWLAIGDAAIGRDPLSSSGIDFALASAERAFFALQAIAAGDTHSLAAYDADLQRDFGAYIKQRTAFYSMEQRWPDAIFWARRRHGDVFALETTSSADFATKAQPAASRLQARHPGMPEASTDPQ
ncbi:MAG TPA: NAD(P)/FAD-dependent oxidoreductase [Candidatus Angelobacter sp.]|nr:NAD(P)/FAD-dependent oxidoreductase [Candidatus Angelobacter sp.]